MCALVTGVQTGALPIWVYACTPAAQAQGVKPGMRSGTALGLTPDIALAVDQAQARQDYLQEIALCLLQYTPNVAFFEEHALLPEVRASHRVLHWAWTRLRLPPTSRCRARSEAHTSELQSLMRQSGGAVCLTPDTQ